MTFSLNIPRPEGDPIYFSLSAGEIAFLLGANGTGKSSLMYQASKQADGKALRVTAQRQTWMDSDGPELTSANRVTHSSLIGNTDKTEESRFKDTYGNHRLGIMLFDLVSQENNRARKIAKAVDAEIPEDILAAKDKKSVLTQINELLANAGIPVQLSLGSGERILAKKSGGLSYGASGLSDGERSTLILAGNVLTAPGGSLVLIDEPERHLHRSISAPLLSELVRLRDDCAFVVSTHDIDLPMDFPEAPTVLVRGCNFTGRNCQSWEADLLDVGTEVDDILKRDLLGARRKIVFVEGNQTSLDKKLYERLLPGVSVLPKGGCSDVEQAVKGGKDTENFNWLQVAGIVDADGFDDAAVAAKRAICVYALPFEAVEAIYYHPTVISAVAVAQCEVSGDNAAAMSHTALSNAVSKIRDHTERLSKKAAKKRVRRAAMSAIPNDDILLTQTGLQATFDGPAIHTYKKTELDAAVTANDWAAVIKVCPIKKTEALDAVSIALGFRTRTDYEKAVLHQLDKNPELLNTCRSFLNGLPAYFEIQ